MTQTPYTELLKLAERCEAATGPDRELDLHIEAAINPDYAGMDEDHARWLAKYGGHPRYTASIDAALSLVPEGFARCEFGRYAAGHWAMLSFSGEMECTEGTGATVSLALCAAALRARSEAAAVGGR